MADLETLSIKISEQLSQYLQRSIMAVGELTIEIAPQHIREVALILRDHPELDFKCLIDVCGVDYLYFGIDEWQTESATETGFERGVESSAITPHVRTQPRFAAVYHLLSLDKNQRIRVRAYLDDHIPTIDSVIAIWPSANWFEREAFDLFGILFNGHPDLRRILTDYGFIGHPFRKDFPLIGNVEVRYDAKLARVIYEPVSIQPRILEPKVIRRDNRYQVGE